MSNVMRRSAGHMHNFSRHTRNRTGSRICKYSFSTTRTIQQTTKHKPSCASTKKEGMRNKEQAGGKILSHRNSRPHSRDRGNHQNYSR